MRRLLLALPLIAAGCADFNEPHERAGTWRASGANDANLRAMVADPSHLDRGVAPATPARGEPATRAINVLGTPAAPRLPAGGTRTPSGNQGGGAPTPGAP